MREIEFKHPHLKDEFLFLLHPRLRDAARTFDSIASLLGAPPTVVTCISRDVRENAKVGGVATSLHLRKMGEQYVRAVDLRCAHYSELQRRTLAGCLHVMALDAKGLDVVTIEHGTGPHFHLEWEGS